MFNQKDEVINCNLLRILESGLKPILCIGESKEEYEAGLNTQVLAPRKPQPQPQPQSQKPRPESLAVDMLLFLLCNLMSVSLLFLLCNLMSVSWIHWHTSSSSRPCPPPRPTLEQICAIQLAKGLKGVSKDQMDNVVIAYEPVWAIGTGLVCGANDAQDVHAFIRKWIAGMYDQATADKVRIQYGGSVTPESVDELMAQPDIDGCLVGGASLDAAKFTRIMNFK